MEFRYSGDALWTRMERAVERVTERLRKTVRILEDAGIPYAIVGGNAVRAWVAQVDVAAVRTTKDVDVLIRPDDLPKMIKAMESGGFYYRQTLGLDMFVEHPEASTRDAVHVIFSGQMVRADDYEPNPDVEPFEKSEAFRTLQLETLVRMKLNSFRLKDRVHLVDMIEIGLIDKNWPNKFPDPLRLRLQRLIDDPDA